MLKLISTLLVISGTFGMGLVYKNRLKLRIAALEEMERMFAILESEIQYHKGTLDEICRNTVGKMKAPFDAFLEGIIERVQLNNGRSFQGIWTEAMKEWKSHPLEYLKEEDYLLLDWMNGSETMFQDESMLIQYLELQKEKVRNKREALQAERSAKEKLYISVGIMSGVMLSILFL